MPFTPLEASFVRKIIDRIDILESSINEAGIRLGVNQSKVKTTRPHTEGVNIHILAANDITEIQPYKDNIVFSSEGPFLAERVHFAWKLLVDTSDPANPVYGSNFRPFSSVEQSYYFLNIPDQNIINFLWEYYVSGSSRKRQNIPVPSSIVERAERGNGSWDMFVHDVFPPGATVTFKITPTVLPPYEGVLYCGFHGGYVSES